MNAEYGRPLAAESAAGTAPRVRQQPSRRALRLRLHLALIALDMLCLVASFALAALIYPIAANDQWIIIPTVVPIYLIAAFGAHAYSVEVIQDVGRGVARSLRSFVIAAGAVLLLAFYLRSSTEISRVLFAVGMASSVVTLSLARVLFARGARSILGGNPYTVVLITENPRDMIPGEFSIAIPASSFDPESQDPQMYDRLANALRHADRVVVGCAPERRTAWVHALQGANIEAEILAPELKAMAPMAIAHLGGAPTLVIARGPLSFPDRILKRAFDVVVAALALLLLAPVLIAVAIAVKLESPGPVFFIQTRIGRSNKLFRMFKFRSMRAEASDGHGHTSTARDDDRITAVGAFIRRTSIDELPQLLNVLLGDMSIVGPRPHALGSRAEDKLFWEIDHRYWHRHATKPGLTGLAQVRGYRGATDQEADLVNRLHADLEYLNNWSIWRDVKIIFMTFRVLRHSNAY